MIFEYLHLKISRGQNLNKWGINRLVNHPVLYTLYYNTFIILCVSVYVNYVSKSITRRGFRTVVRANIAVLTTAPFRTAD